MPNAQRFEKTRDHVVRGDGRHEFNLGLRIESGDRRREHGVRHLHIHGHRIGQGWSRSFLFREGTEIGCILQRSQFFFRDAGATRVWHVCSEFKRRAVERRDAFRITSSRRSAGTEL